MRIPGQVIVPTDEWRQKARDKAEQVLKTFISEEKHYIIPSFVEGVVVVAFRGEEGTGMVWTLERVKEIAVKVAGLTEDEKNAIWQKRRALISRDAVATWVATQKKKTKRDEGQSDDVITNRILAIIFSKDPSMEADARALLFGKDFEHSNYLLEFRTGFLEKALFEDEINLWLRIILLGWRDLILDQLPRMMRARLEQAWKASAA